MEFTHSVLVPNESITVNTVKSYDLPVNPMSHALLTIKFAQNLANTQAVFANIVGMLSKVEVLYKGASVISLNGSDLWALGKLICGFESWGVNNLGDDNELRSMTYLIPFGRKLYNPEECYPKSTRGELILQLTYASAFTNIDTGYLQVETIEMPAATPKQYLRATTLAQTPTATGELSVQLPIGNKLSDVIIWGTTIPSASTATKTINSVELEVNNLERIYAKTYFETLHNMAGRWGPAPGYFGSHIHQIDGAAFAQYMDTGAVKAANHVLANYLYLPIDVHQDGQFILETAGLSQLELVIDAGDTNAFRIIPVEIVAT